MNRLEARPAVPLTKRRSRRLNERGEMDPRPLCEPHQDRGFSIAATKDVAGTPMCEACFLGRPVSTTELAGELGDSPPLKPIAVTTKRTERKSSRRIGGGARRGENLAWEVLARGRWALAMFAQKRRRCERLPVVLGCLLGIDNNIAPDPDCGCGCWYRNRITVVPATLAACQKKSR
jgi:hypothetical protein